VSRTNEKSAQISSLCDYHFGHVYFSFSSFTSFYELKGLHKINNNKQASKQHHGIKLSPQSDNPPEIENMCFMAPLMTTVFQHTRKNGAKNTHLGMNVLYTIDVLPFRIV
jgi:hypothetical protein